MFKLIKSGGFDIIKRCFHIAKALGPPSIRMNLKLTKWRVAAYLLFIFLVLLAVFSAITCAQTSGEAYIYCFPESTSSETLFSYFNNKSDWKVIVYNLNDSASSERFLDIMKTLAVLGIEVTPPEMCLSCELQHSRWGEIWMAYASPLVGFFHNGRLKAITIGIINYETLDQALIVNDEDVEVFTPYDIRTLSDEKVKTQLEEFFLRKEEVKIEINIFNLLLSITLLALADSVNPCTFTFFTALLFIALHSLGKTKAATTGLSFITAIFIGYYILGAGLFQVLIAIPNKNKVMGVLGVVIGALSITRGLKPKFKPPIPKSFRTFIELRISKSYANPIASFTLGLIASFTLLPCSSGPYIVGLGLIPTLNNPIQVYISLALYNTIFVTPLIAILIAVLASNIHARRIKAFRSKRLGVMELISGSLLAIVCIYLFLS